VFIQLIFSRDYARLDWVSWDFQRRIFEGCWGRIFYRLDPLPIAQPTLSKHWRDMYTLAWECTILSQFTLMTTQQTTCACTWFMSQ